LNDRVRNSVNGSSGAVTLDGAGSKWTNSGNFEIEMAGDGSLTVSNGGVVTSLSGELYTAS
jgi:T5SS/PEP-CTERM-associated repeat protein